MSNNAEHCSFVLLAEFDIDKGAQLTYQFPQPLGTDDSLLANLMLPDGAEKQPEDWTIFFLNQTPFNTIAPVLALESSDTIPGSQANSLELLYVLNLVRTKRDKTLRRGAVVKAMAICTRHPFIQIFKPVLLLALDDYFSSPSQDCLARLFDAINSMDLSAAPILSRAEKLVMRNSERKDVFAEKFLPARLPAEQPSLSRKSHKPTQSNGSYASFEDSVNNRGREATVRERAGTESTMASTGTNGSYASVPTSIPGNNGLHSPSELTFPRGGNAAWTSEENTATEHGVPAMSSSTGSSTGAPSVSRGRRSTDASSTSSHGYSRPLPNHGSFDPQARVGFVKDTHFFQTTIDYKGHQLPIKIPLSTFPEEVGDYSLIQLIQTLSNPIATISGPLHPHLHTNGSLTHPIMILFNALITGKRIIFLGYHRAAGQVSSYVLSACALGSGCGTVLSGFIERAFPYANLTNRDEWESLPSYIAGVTNPIFEAIGNWDLLCDVGGGRMVISKDIHTNHPPSGPLINTPSLISRSGTGKAESLISDEDLARRDNQKSDFTAKADNPDNIFIEEIITAISYHYGEGLIRARFTEYVQRFIRLASRYEEEITGTTTIGFPSSPFMVTGDSARLGSGMTFGDDTVGSREMSANASRIEGWRRTSLYNAAQMDFHRSLSNSPIQGFDLAHQIYRLRFTKNMSDAEVELIMRTLLENVQTYDQVVELLALLPSHAGGLLPLSFGLFHQQEYIRDLTADLFTQMRMFPIGVQALQALNHFHRYAYVRQAYVRERPNAPQSHLSVPPPMPAFSRTNSSRSDIG